MNFSNKQAETKRKRKRKDENTKKGNNNLRKDLDRLYRRYNRRRFVHPDPLEFLYAYPDPLDREIASLIASSLAYGRVAQILRSVSSVLERMAPSPRAFLLECNRRRLQTTFCDFKHRFTEGQEVARLLWAAREIMIRWGSLQNCFSSGLQDSDPNIFPALCAFVREFYARMPAGKNSLLPIPERGSACKRLNLFLRWMVRKDEVDPGGWSGIQTSRLIVPLDTHMHRICLRLGFTSRRQADIRTAIEITEAFKKIDPRDPVRYDFSLTRLGIWKMPMQEICR